MPSPVRHTSKRGSALNLIACSYDTVPHSRISNRSNTKRSPHCILIHGHPTSPIPQHHNTTTSRPRRLAIRLTFIRQKMCKAQKLRAYCACEVGYENVEPCERYYAWLRTVPAGETFAKYPVLGCEKWVSC